jgi:hypothetical protein
MLIKMSINTWSLIGNSLGWITQSDMLGVAEVNRVVNRNIYTILECDEESESETDPDSTESSWISFNLDTDLQSQDEVSTKTSHEKIEKKIDVYKIMKEYVKKHRKKY